MTALTVELLDREGHFQLVSDNGQVTATGVARASVTKPGYVNLTFTKVHCVWTPGTPVRVPADWYEALGAYE